MGVNVNVLATGIIAAMSGAIAFISMHLVGIIFSLIVVINVDGCRRFINVPLRVTEQRVKRGGLEEGVCMCQRAIAGFIVKDRHHSCVLQICS